MDKGKKGKSKKQGDAPKQPKLSKMESDAKGEDPQTNPTEETETKESQKKVEESTSPDTTKLQGLLEGSSAVAAGGSSTDPAKPSTSKDTQEKVDDKSNPPSNAAKRQEKLTTTNVPSDDEVLPPEIREKIDETKYLGDELLEAMNGFVEVGDEYEQRKKQEKSPKDLEDDKND